MRKYRIPPLRRFRYIRPSSQAWSSSKACAVRRGVGPAVLATLLEGRLDLFDSSNAWFGTRLSGCINDRLRCHVVDLNWRQFVDYS